MLSSDLRHRVTLQARTEVRGDQGSLSYTWADWLADEPAQVTFLSGREFIAAQSNQSQIMARVAIRWREGVDGSMRLIHEGVTYNVTAVLPDPSTRRWLTLMIAGGVNDGQ